MSCRITCADLVPPCAQMMLHVWNTHIFTDIRHRLQLAAINLLEAERNGEVFDSQLVVGVRESYGESHDSHVIFIKFINIFNFSKP